MQSGCWIMPNRVIKESICTSDRLNELTDFQFRLWVGLLVTADDAGRGDARPAIIRGRVFPLRERLALKEIEDGLRALAANGCVSYYKVDGKPYYWFPTWTAHQRLDRAKPKYPAPEDADPPESAADCGNLPQIAADRGLNTNTKENTNTNTKEKGNNARGTRFTPPDIDSVSEFIKENGYSVDPQRFVDYYTANGWKVGKNPMKDWKAAVRGWASRDNSRKTEQVKSNPALQYAQRTYTEEEAASFYCSYDDLEALYGNKV